MPPKKLNKLSNIDINSDSDDSTSDSDDSTSDSESDNEVTIKSTVQTNDESDSESELPKKKLSIKLSKPEVIEVENDSDDINNESDLESVSDSEQDKKSKDKKNKESFEELTKKLDKIQNSIKIVDKEISETEKHLKVKEKLRNDYERQRNSILKILSKTHKDEITKAQKEGKTTRKGNINGGFNKDQPVPEILKRFLGLSPDAVMKRPQVMSLLNSKFTELKLKQGQETKLNKATVKELELDNSWDGKVIKFTEFQTFLKQFYPSKEEKNIVSIA